MRALSKRLFSALIWFALLAQSGNAQVLLRSIPAPTVNSTQIAWDGAAFWVADNTSTIYRISPLTGAVIRTITGPVAGSDGLTWDGQYLWTVSAVLSNQTVFKLDTANGAVVSQIQDPAAGYAGGASWDGQWLWISQYFPTDAILKVNPASGAIQQTLPAPGEQPYGLASYGSYLWNASQDTGDDHVFRLVRATGEITWSFALPHHETLPNRRIRGLQWVDSTLWICARDTSSLNVRLYEYDVSNATNPDIQIAAVNHTFGSHVVGFPESWSTSIVNVGNVALRLDSMVFFSGAAYHLTSPSSFPLSLAADSIALVTIQFDPPQAGDYEDTLRIYSNDPDENPLWISLSGTGLPDEGDIAVEPTQLDFGEVWVPNPLLSSSRILQIQNSGSGVLSVSGITLSVGSFFRMDPITLPASIDSHSSTAVRVWFEPDSPGAFEDVLTVTSDDPDQPLVDISLTGSAAVQVHETGETFWHFWAAPIGTSDNGINSVKWLGDVNDDGIPDVVAASRNSMTYCLNGSSTGQADTLWTFSTRTDPNHSGYAYYEACLQTIVDLTGDGVSDVLLGTAGLSRSVYAISGVTGEQLWTFDTRSISAGGGWINALATMPDMNGDGLEDVVCGATEGGGDGPRRVFCLSGSDGSLEWQGPQFTSFYAVQSIQDVTGDSIPDVVGGTSGWVVGMDGATGSQLWQSTIASGSPCFELVPMGNANPGANNTEDVAVASAYYGVYAVDGGNGAHIWSHPIAGQSVYEVDAGSDITSDGIREVYVGTASGILLCLDGSSGEEIWQFAPDPSGPENILSMAVIPDVTGDDISDILCGTLGDFLVVVEGWDHQVVFATQGEAPSGPVDAVSYLPDIDNSRVGEVIAGNREGSVTVLSCGGTFEASDPRRNITIPKSAVLLPCFPNPFNPATTIPYSLNFPGRVSITVFDVLGRRVATLYDGYREAGMYHVEWRGFSASGTSAGTGTYFVRLKTEQTEATRRITLVK